MVQNHGAAVAALVEQPHEHVHVLVALVDEGLVEPRQRRADIAEMDYEDLVAGDEVADRRRDVAEGGSALQPAAGTELHPQVVGVGDGKGPVVALPGADQAGDAGNRRHRRIVGMQRQSHAGLLGDRDDALHEIGEVVPDRSLVVGPAVAERFCGKLGAVYRPCRRPAARHCGSRAPYSVRLEGEGGGVDSRRSQVAQERREPLDCSVASRQRQVDPVALSQGAVADVEQRQTGVLHPPAQCAQLRRAAQLRGHPGEDVAQPQLGHETQVGITRLRRNEHRQLDARAQFHGGSHRRQRAPSCLRQALR